MLLATTGTDGAHLVVVSAHAVGVIPTATATVREARAATTTTTVPGTVRLPAVDPSMTTPRPGAATMTLTAATTLLRILT